MFTLYFFLLFANGIPVQLENVEKFETKTECLADGKIKAPSLLQEMADKTGVPVRGWVKCKKEVGDLT